MYSPGELVSAGKTQAVITKMTANASDNLFDGKLFVSDPAHRFC